MCFKHLQYDEKLSRKKIAVYNKNSMIILIFHLSRGLKYYYNSSED